MLLAALAMAVLFLCLTQSLAELAAALPQAGGFDGYVRRALGPTAAYLAGMSVAIALAVGAGLAVSFSEAYVSAWLGFGGWPVKLAFLIIVMGLQLRGASEAVGLTVAVGVAALVILVAFCLYMAPEYQSARLFSVTAGRREKPSAPWLCGSRSLHPVCTISVSGRRAVRARSRRDARYGAKHAQSTGNGDRRRLRDWNVRALDRKPAERAPTGLPPSMTLCLRRSRRTRDEPGRLSWRVWLGPERWSRSSELSFHWHTQARGSFYHLAQAGFLPRVFGGVNSRQAPAAAVYLVGVIGLATAAFPPNNAMVVFIFLISVSHLLILAAFLRLRHREPELARTYRALGGSPIAALALLLSVSVMVSCYQLEARALQVAIAAIVLLTAQFVFLRPARLRAS